MLWRRTHTLLWASTAAQGHLCARTQGGSQSLSRALLVQHKFCTVKDEKESKTTRKVVLFLPADEIRPHLHKEMVQSCPRSGSCSSSTLALKHKCPWVKVPSPFGALNVHTLSSMAKPYSVPREAPVPAGLQRFKLYTLWLFCSSAASAIVLSLPTLKVWEFPVV